MPDFVDTVPLDGDESPANNHCSDCGQSWTHEEVEDDGKFYDDGFQCPNGCGFQEF